MNQNNDMTLRQAALWAGFALLIMIVVAPFGFLVQENFVLPDNPMQTVTNIIANIRLFRLSILAFLIVTLTDLIVAWAMYIFLKPVNSALSLLGGWFRFAHAIIFAVSTCFLFLAIQIIGSATDPTTMVLPFCNVFNHGYLIGQFFFSCHLFIIGLLLFKSGYGSRLIAILLMIGGLFGYMIDSITNLFLPGLTLLALPGLIVGTIAELSLMLWLLIKGGKQI